MPTDLLPADRLTIQPTSQHLAISRSAVINGALTLMLAFLWSSTHHFLIFARDGTLYAVQAMARINPVLGLDVYLANVSQDRFTVFSGLYAWFIQWVGLGDAARLLLSVCTVSFATAAWVAARGLIGSNLAWLAVLMLIVTTGTYGPSEIFNYSENYLTARSLAEALIVTALAFHIYGWRSIGLVIAAAAMFVHPLMALPGLIMLILLWLPIRHAIAAVAIGCLATLAVALVAVAIPQSAHLFTIMDAPWLEVVQERSQFLFLKYWKFDDWELQLRPFMCLTMSLLVFDDTRVRRVCAMAMLVGGAGLIVTGIAGSVGPVAILLQGQAWRWCWITVFMGVLLVAPTAVRVWQNPKCGPICATLMIAGWTFPVVDGLALISLAVLIWSLRSRIDIRTGIWLRWAAYALIAIIAAWALANAGSVLMSPRVVTTRESLLMDRIRSILTLQIIAVAAFGLFWYGIRSCRSLTAPLVAAALVGGLLAVTLPNAVESNQTAGTAAEIAEFSDWRAAMSGPGSVLLVSKDQWVSFVWFTLQRPSYISVSQSAGVVFSRATALEIHRRADVVSPVMKPSWRVLSSLTPKAGKKVEDLTRPLTVENLVAICVDPELGYVIAKESIGFDAIRHTHAGVWKDWNLYDCRRVRSAAAKT